MRRRAIVVALSIAACSSKSSTTSSPAPTGPAVEVHRFAVGVVPSHCLPGLGEAPHCCFEFVPPRLDREGPFTGTCGGKTYTHVAFEAVKVGSVKVSLAASNRGLIGDTELDHGPLLLDAAHPEWTISLGATPLDAQGNRLETGADSGLRGLTRWSWGPGCEKVMAAKPYEKPGEGFERPADEIQLEAKSVGTCDIEASYADARAKVTVRVR